MKKKWLQVWFVVMGVLLFATGCSNATTKTGGHVSTGTETEAQADAQKDAEESADTKKGTEEQTDANTKAKTEAQTATKTEKEPESSSDTNGSQGEKNDQEKDSSPEETTLIAKNGDLILARPSVNGALGVKGTQLVDEKGEPVQLRGISTHGIAWFPDYINRECFGQLSDEFGANLMRIAMYTDENGGYCKDGNKSQLKELVLNGVQYAKEADMYVIVDWHILHDNNPLTHKDEALKFFEEITAALRYEKHVIYEICNEPNSGTGWEDVKSYADEVLPVIRKNAPNAVVLIGTPTWCQEIDKPQNDPVTGYDNIMYTLHFYAATHKEDLRKKMVSAIKAGTPVMVSEFGLCDASGNGGNDLQEAQKWIDTLDTYGVSYAVWSLCNKNETASLIAASCQKKSDFSAEDLSESGKWIYDMLHAKGSNTGGKDDIGGSSQLQNGTDTKSETNDTGKQQNNHFEKNDSNHTENIDSASVQATNENLEVNAEITGSWESEGKTFYQYQLTVTNKGEEKVSAWEISLVFSENIALSDGWNGEYLQDGNKLVIRCKDYNAEIEAGASVTDIGFIISGSKNFHFS